MLNLNKSVRKWSGSVNNVLLDEFTKFRFLEIHHLYSKIAREAPSSGSQQGTGTVQKTTNQPWHFKELASCTTRANASGRCLSVNTDTSVHIAEGTDTLKRIAQQRRTEEFRVRGERPKQARDLLWERGEDEVGPTTLHPLMAKLLPCPPVAALKDEVGMNAIQDHPELFKIVCQIDVNALKRLLEDLPNPPLVQLVLCGL